MVFKRDNYTCLLCRTQFLKEESKHLRADYKGPVSKMGDAKESDPDWMEKFQTVCQWCNYEKRETCKVCQRQSCLGCELYDPKGLHGLMLKFDSNTLSALADLSRARNQSPNELVKNIIRLYLNK
jgi:hypothetical protein